MPAIIFPRRIEVGAVAPAGFSLPTLTVEIGTLGGWQLGVAGHSELGDTTQLTFTEWVDVGDVYSVSIRRGRQHELDRVEAGTASVSLPNQDGAFNATNTSSPFYPFIRPMTPLRISAAYPGQGAESGWGD